MFQNNTYLEKEVKPFYHKLKVQDEKFDWIL